MPVNNNYIPLVTMGDFDVEVDAYYTAQSVGAFNELYPLGDPSNQRTFAAFVAFNISGGYQRYTIDQDSAPVSRWLWGNLDTTGKPGSGWAFLLRASPAGQGQIVAIVADGAGNLIEAAVDITGPNLPSPADHLIFATLFFETADADGVTIVLGLNGSVAASTRSVVADGYTASSYAARLGTDAATGNSIRSLDVEFLSCGFSPLGPLPNAFGGDITDQAALNSRAWRGFVASVGGNNLVTQDFGVDWKHRYHAAALAQGVAMNNYVRVPGGIVPTSGPLSYAVPPTLWPDIGGQSIALGTTPVPVNLTGAGTSARVLSVANLPMYIPPAVVFATALP